jgi:alpha-glucosidase
MITVDAPLETVPMFVRAGAMIPTAPPRNYVGEKPGDPVTVNVYPDDRGVASGALYEDDGKSPAYKRGMFRRTRMSARREGDAFVVSIDSTEGEYSPGTRALNFILKGHGSTPIRLRKT